MGEGGTAVTYEAEDTKENRSVAIKVLSLHQSQEWKIIELFEREAKVLGNLNHPLQRTFYAHPWQQNRTQKKPPNSSN